jgi:hypothetical protein
MPVKHIKYKSAGSAHTLLGSLLAVTVIFACFSKNAHAAAVTCADSAGKYVVGMRISGTYAGDSKETVELGVYLNKSSDANMNSTDTVTFWYDLPTNYDLPNDPGAVSTINAESQTAMTLSHVFSSYIKKSKTSLSNWTGKCRYGNKNLFTDIESM